MNSPFSSISIKREEFDSGGASVQHNNLQQPQRIHLNSGGPSPVLPLLLASSSHHAPFVPAVRPLGGAARVSDGTSTGGGATFSRPSHLTEAQQRGTICPQQRPSSGDANTTIAQFLMNYVVGSDREFTKKAIESLIKKLKDKRDELDDFIASVSSMGQLHTKCVTTPRTLDGRLQVNGRKGFPHVVYSKIFRWPDLHKNELKHRSFCICAFDLKVEQVCVNPYHYERVVSVEGIELESNSCSPSHSSEVVSPTIGHAPSFPPTKNVPAAGAGSLSATARGPGRPPNAFRQQLNNLPPNSTMPNGNSSVRTQRQFAASAAAHSQQNMTTPLNHRAQAVHSQHQQQQRVQTVQQWQQQTTSIGGCAVPNQNQVANSAPALCTASAVFHGHHNQQQSHAAQLHHQRYSPQATSPHSSMSPQMAAVAIGGTASHSQQATFCPPNSSSTQRQLPQYVHQMYQQHSQHQQAPLPSAQIPTANSAVSYDPRLNSNGNQQGIGQFYCSPVTAPTRPYPSEFDTIPAPFFDAAAATKAPVFKYVSGITEFSKARDRPFISDKPMPLHWCAANYYEFDRRVGETFQAAADCPQIFVDGGLDSTDNARFCLGPLTNTERGEAAEKCRLNIGRGIRLDLKGEGDVWLTVLCKGPVFVQSHYLDVLTEREELGHSHKFVQFTTVKVFDLSKCYECWKITHLDRIMAHRVNRETRTRRIRLDNHNNRTTTASSGGGGKNATANNRTNAGGGECSDDETSADDPGADDFRTLSTVRISFFKGFGLSYPKRTIQETPCWFELHLNRALQLLDEVMNTPLIDHLT